MFPWYHNMLQLFADVGLSHLVATSDFRFGNHLVEWAANASHWVPAGDHMPFDLDKALAEAPRYAELRHSLIGSEVSAVTKKPPI